MAGRALGVAESNPTLDGVTVSGDSQIGTATTHKVGFYGTAPVTQPTSASQASAVFTKKITGVGFTTSAKFLAFVALVMAIRTALVSQGLIKGS